MISAVVDTNVLVAGVISASPRSANKGVVDAFLASRFTLLLSPATLQEVQRVLADEELGVKHGLTDAEIGDFCRVLESNSRVLEPTSEVPASLTRDITDTKWVALALSGDADYLVTLDRRHLLRLKNVGRTKIVRPRPFLRVLDE